MQGVFLTMTTFASGPHDRELSKQATGHHSPNTHERSDDNDGTPLAKPTQRDVVEEREVGGERKRRGPVGIGAPLTAAFVGGLLVIENLASADLAEEPDIATLSDDTLMLGGESGENADAAPGEGRTATTTGAGEGDAANAADPEAAPTEDGAIASGEGTSPASTPAAPVLAAADAGTALPEEEGGGGSDPALNFFDIDLDSGDVGSGVDSFIEDDVLVRNRQDGTRGDDELVGTDGDDAISGGLGDDTIFGGAGNDLLNGNDGDDRLFGGSGEDNLKGGSGNDILDGGDDYDNLLGGSGDDILIINGQHDVALDYDSPANSGSDTLVVEQGYADDLALSGIDRATFFFSSENTGDQLPSGVASHAQQVAVGIEHISLEGTADIDIVADSGSNRLAGNDGDNLIIAGEGDDEVIGGAGRDDLRGDDGDDELLGGAGDDVIAGGLGEDRLFGEGGDDVFVVGLNDNAIDTIFDHSGANSIRVEGVTDQQVGASLLDSDLYITADDTPIARVSDYVGNEDTLTGVDFGQGLQTVGSLLTDHEDLGSAIADVEAEALVAASDDILAAHLNLTEPTIAGTSGGNERLDGTEGADWLSGSDGKDVLFGHDGDDILAGGDGVDRLAGGAGDDAYLFVKGENGIDKITDNEGQNYAKLEGFDRAKVEGALLGDDLAVLADGEVLFTVQDFTGNEGSFHGVHVNNKIIETEDLLA